MAKLNLDIAKKNLVRASDRLKAARLNFDLGQYEVTINRSYYSVFASMKAALTLEGKEEKSHKQLISDFRKDFIKTKILPVELSEDIQDTFMSREECDYEDDFISTQEKAEYCLNRAEHFFDVVSRYVNSKIDEFGVNQTLNFDD